VDIVIILWKIKAGADNRQAFFKHWAEKLEIDDKAGLVGEFLSCPQSADEAGPEFSVFGAHASDEYELYFNVAIWETLDAFRAEVIEKYLGGDPADKPFLFEPPRRMALSPKQWRVGAAPLPAADHLLPF
jgi:hypothetical protein